MLLLADRFRFWLVLFFFFLGFSRGFYFFRQLFIQSSQNTVYKFATTLPTKCFAQLHSFIDRNFRWDFVRKQVKLGRQVYIVYPVIEGSRDDQPELDFSHDEPAAAVSEPISQPAKTIRKGKTAELFSDIAGQKPASKGKGAELKSAVTMHEKLRAGPLKGIRVGLLHGRLEADDKEINDLCAAGQGSPAEGARTRRRDGESPWNFSI